MNDTKPLSCADCAINTHIADNATGDPPKPTEPNSQRTDAGSGAMPHPSGIDAVIGAERRLLGLPPEDRDQARTMALCLSGGGIRSATFSLGVLQGLAKRGLLGQFHYLSTVSGGGYIGTWLSAWISRRSRAEVEQKLAESTDAGASRVAGGYEAAAIKRLRAYSNFLSPVHGVSADSAALVAIYVRNLLLHWAMLLPVFFAVLLIPRVFNSLLMVLENAKEPDRWLINGIAALLFYLATVFACLDVSLTQPRKSPNADGEPPKSWVWPCFVLPMIVAIFVVLLAHSTNKHHAPPSFGPGIQLLIIAGTLVGGSAAVAALAIRAWRDRLYTPFPWKSYADCGMFLFNNAATGAVAGALTWIVLYGIDRYGLDTQATVTFGFPLLICALSLAAIVRAGLSRRWTTEEVREWWGRASGLLGLIALGWLLLSLIVIQIPHWLLSLAATKSNLTAGVAGTGGVLLTIITAVAGYWSENGAQIKEKAHSLSRTIGVQVMELAGLASILVVALLASLLMGFLLTRQPFAADQSLDKCTFASTKKVALDPQQPDAPVCPAVDKQPGTGTQTPGQKKAGTAGASANGASASTPGTTRGSTQTATVTQPGANAGAASSGEKDAGTEESLGSSDSTSAGTPVPTAAATAATEAGDENRPPLEHSFAFQWLVRHQLSLHMKGWLPILLLSLALCFTGLVASYFFGANAFSLNALYGNRLTRAYLGASRSRKERNPHSFVGFDSDDNIQLSALEPKPDAADCVRLFPVVNAALNLIKPSGDRLEWQQRKAASFFMTPQYCGSDVLTFVPTAQYSSKPDGLTAGRAMAISGAAAAPSMGYHSSRFVSMLMAFFNVRLGWWMPNPKCESVLGESEPQIGLVPVITELLSCTNARRRFVYLSDGGHFENLGLYEMVRRRCNRILVVDAGCDPEYQYEDLENAIRKIRVDFGIEILFDAGLLRPDDARNSKRHYCRGRIRYSQGNKDVPDGDIIYIKPVLSGDEPVDVRRYAESTRSNGRVFPQQPTSDQFFDEAQFESYRELGLHSVLETFRSEAGANWPALPDDTPAAAAPSDDNKTLPGWAPETKKTGGISLLASFGSLGQAAVLASALTVTAAITVTGTVALKDKELHLAPGSQELKVTADEPLRVTMDRNTAVRIDMAGSIDTYLNQPDGEAVRRLAEVLNQSLADIELKVSVVGGTGGTPEDPRLAAVIDAVKNAAEKLAEVSATLKGTSDSLSTASGNLNSATTTLKNEINGTVEALRKAIMTLDNRLEPVGGNLQKVHDMLLAAKLTEMKDTLIRIEERVQKISPRETVRGN